MTVKLSISDTAADCLAFFMDHPFYSNTPSEVIINLTEEWGLRRKDPEFVNSLSGMKDGHFDRGKQI